MRNFTNQTVINEDGSIYKHCVGGYCVKIADAPKNDPLDFERGQADHADLIYADDDRGN